MRLAAQSTKRLVSRPLSVRLEAAFGVTLLTVVGIGIAGAAIPEVGGAIILGGIPLAVAAFLRGFRISLTADRDAIVVRNYLRTHRIRWEEIVAIGVGFHGMAGAPFDAVVIRRRDRGVVSAQATVSSSRERRRVLTALERMRPDVPIRFG